jgi:hypothetical protein
MTKVAEMNLKNVDVRHWQWHVRYLYVFDRCCVTGSRPRSCGANGAWVESVETLLVISILVEKIQIYYGTVLVPSGV